MSLWKNLFTGFEGHACAQNAHLAELLIRSQPAERRAEIIESLHTVLRRGREYAAYGDKQLEDAFDDLPRVAQMNFLAIAMKDLGIECPGEPWLPVRNPLYTSMDAKDIQLAAQHFLHKHGLCVDITGVPICLEQWRADGSIVRGVSAPPAAPDPLTVRARIRADAKGNPSEVSDCPVCHRDIPRSGNACPTCGVRVTHFWD